MRMIPMSVVLTLLTVGCASTTGSRNIRTPGVVAVIDVTSESARMTTVETELVVGDASSNTYLVLEDGDRLSAALGTETRVMTAVDEGEYEARFPVDQGEVVVSFERDDDDDAPTSRGTIGPGFKVEDPYGGKPFSRSKRPLELRWTPVDPQAEVTVELDGDCIFWKKIRLGGDTGLLQLPPGKVKSPKSKRGQTCAIEVEITRTRQGDADPALDSDSVFRLHQVRRTRIVAAP